jgi:hypothetical protein
LHTRSGIPVPLTVTSVDVVDGKVELAADATAEAWATIEGALLLNLDSALDADGELPPMMPGGEAVSFTARLLDDAAVALLADGGDLLAAVVGAPEGSAIDDTEAWFLASARAAGGQGYVTPFAAADAALGKRAPSTFTVEVFDDDDEEGAEEAAVPGRLLALALSFLAAAEIDVDVLGATIAGGVYEGRNGPIDLVVISREEAEQLLVYARCHDPVPEDRRAEVMELVTRLNPQLPGTWFELELDTGRVSCRATLNARGTDVTDDTFAENVIWLALTTMDEHQPALRGVAFEGISVAAIRAADDELDAEG